MLVTDAGIEMDVIALEWKALLPIVANVLGKVTDAKDVQP